MKIHYFILLLGICYFSQSLRAQVPPTFGWGKTLGGSYYDEAFSVQQTTDGGYVVAGFSGSHDGDVTGNHLSEDFWVVKLSPDDSLVWETSLGGYATDAASSIYQTADGGYIVAGYTSSTDGDVLDNHGKEDVWIVKLDQNGEKQWQKALGGTENERCSSIAEMSNGNFILGAYSSSSDGDLTSNSGGYDYWLISLNSAGDLLWQHSYGGSDTDLVYSAVHTSDGGYILAGTTYSTDGDVTASFGGGDVWVVKTDSAGMLLWEKSYGGSLAEQGNAIIELKEGGFLITGISYSSDGDVTGNHGLGDCWMLLLDTAGMLLWENCFGSDHADGGNSLYQRNSNEFIVAGIASANNGDVSGNHGLGDFWLFNLDSMGNLHWQQCYGGTKTESAFSVKPATNDGYIVAGYTKSNDVDVSGNKGQYDYWVVKLCSGLLLFYPDDDGDSYGDTYDAGTLLCVAPSGFVADSTDCDDTDPFVNPAMLEIPGNGIDDNCNGYTDEFGVGTNDNYSGDSFSLFPNPADDEFRITMTLSSNENFEVIISIQSLSGQIYFAKAFSGFNGRLIEDIALDQKFSQGVYLVTLKTNSHCLNHLLTICQ